MPTNQEVSDERIFATKPSPDEPIVAAEAGLLPSGVTNLCVAWDFDGMSESFTWTVVWLIDGKADLSKGLADQSWTKGPDGTHATCIIDDRGFSDGVYEVALFVGKSENPLIDDAVVVGSDRQTVEFSLVNSSSLEICVVNLAPTVAGYWGQNELSSGESLEPGETGAFQIASGSNQLRVQKCDGKTVYQSASEGIDVTADYELTLTD